MISFSLFLFGFTFVRYADLLSLAAAPKTKVPLIRFFCIHPSDIAYKETNITDTDITKKLDLKLDFAFFVHGWQSEFSFDDKDSTPYKIGLEWVKAKPTNFCGVDWRELANDGYYDASQKHVKYVGSHLAAFIKELNVKMESVSIAGHSLGAHAAGFAGKNIFESNKTKISTIFGLDPAGPLLTSLLVIKPDFVLSKDDANFVQILHTSSGTFGTSKMIGHADFIVNNGKLQKECVDELLKAKDLLFKCSHSFAKEIFLSSFVYSCAGVTEQKSEGFLEKVKGFFSKSKDTNSGTDLYGIHNKGLSGVFQLETSDKKPYCKGIKI